MTVYMCTQCGYKSDKKGVCPKCKIAIEKCCPVCGKPIRLCTCTGDIPQTKGPGLH